MPWQKTSQGLQKVQLYAADFSFVHQGWMPPFNEPPKVLLWGQRIFQYHQDGKYVECFAYALVDLPDPRQERMFEKQSL